MELREGDRVSVNLAPFIGSARHSRESIPCKVLAALDNRVQICTQPPYREVVLWVHRRWIDRVLFSQLETQGGRPGVARAADSFPGDCRRGRLAATPRPRSSTAAPAPPDSPWILASMHDEPTGADRVGSSSAEVDVVGDAKEVQNATEESGE